LAFWEQELEKKPLFEGEEESMEAQGEEGMGVEE
jgi:hypothetical protein